MAYVYNVNLTGEVYFNNVGGDYRRDIDPIYHQHLLLLPMAY